MLQAPHSVDAPLADANEERFRLVAQLSSDSVWDWNLLTHHIWWSDGLTALFGHPIHASIANPNWWRDQIHPDERERVVLQLHAAIHDTSCEWWEDKYRFRTARGVYVDVHDRGRVIRDAQGRGVRMVGAMKDLSAEQTREAEFIHLAEAIPQIVWTADAEGAVTYFNQHWYEYTGLSKEISLTNARWHHAYCPDDLPRLVAAREKARAAATRFEAEFRIRRYDGEYRWFLARGVPLRDRQGQILRWAGTMTDVHEKNLLEEQLRLHAGQATASSIATKEFLTQTSHEIRTPMNAIVGLATLLAESKGLSPQQKEYVSTLQVSAEQLLQLINSLLDIAQLESNHMHLESIPFDLHRLVEEVLCINRVSAQAKQVALGVRGHCHHMLLGDPLRLKQVMMNLVSNAVKFTEEGAVDVNIFCAPRAGEPVIDLMIAVEDTGIGIPPQKIDLIFGKFDQAELSTTRRFGGTGLGLNIAKTLVELMGGSIRVNSTPQKGSCFTVTLALPMADAPAEPAMPTPEIVAAPLPSTPTAPRVLLVEDYPANILVATLLLSKYGYDYALAGNGEEAIKKAAETRFDIILMDVEMPDMNGYEATAAIRAREAIDGHHATIIGMTAHALKGARERCLDAGMDDYLAKPFRPETFKEALARHTAPAEAAL